MLFQACTVLIVVTGVNRYGCSQHLVPKVSPGSIDRTKHNPIISYTSTQYQSYGRVHLVKVGELQRYTTKTQKQQRYVQHNNGAVVRSQDKHYHWNNTVSMSIAAIPHCPAWLSKIRKFKNSPSTRQRGLHIRV